MSARQIRQKPGASAHDGVDTAAFSCAGTGYA
jgi:hypothetical protein